MRNAAIFTPETAQLVSAIDEQTTGGMTARDSIDALVEHISDRCADPKVRERYAAYSDAPGTMEPYPLDSDGYAKAFDPLTQEQEFFAAWQRYGVVVSKQVVPERLCTDAIAAVGRTLRKLSGGAFDITTPETYTAMPVDSQGTPILSRGFFEVYHDDALAQLRQSVRLYLHHVLLWGRHDIWTTFDRYGVKLPEHVESAALPLHVDQNPTVHPDFHTTQGVLALADCPAERGTFRAVPGSKQHFAAYGRMALNKGEYVELDTSDPVADTLAANAQAMPIRQGDIVSWDSRTTHANTANVSSQARYVALISAGPARQEDHAARMARDEAFVTGLGSNVRDALMHASKRPRYTNEAVLAAVRQPEQLNRLGTLVYGFAAYGESTDD